MRFKKIVMSLIASFCTLVIPVSVFADSAGWQLKTSEWVHYNATLDAFITGVNNAHVSGNVLICLREASGRVYFEPKEYDASNADEYISGRFSLLPTSNTNSTDCLNLDISSLEDGDNGQAEVYIQTNLWNAKFAIYD
jgi:hypothetical protein